MTRVATTVLLCLLMGASQALAQTHTSTHRRSRTPHASPTPVRPPPEPIQNFQLEYATGSYRLTQDSMAYSRPSLQSHAIKAVHAGKLVKVTGATLTFVRVQLSDNETGYIPVDAVTLLRPADRNYILSADTPVYSRPHLSSQQTALVHRGRNVHVVGVELNYLRIRMRDGVEGFIPVSTVE
jgi:uncharacterized protein YgiM (DUF1202 family)